jgi:cellobiose phosphorylase
MENFKTKYGYFSNDGNEYVITDPKTPKPWVNVISNGDYGFVISQTGGGFSWQTHSEFNRITRWHQDLIQDNWGKYFYFRNNKTGDVWSPTWLPARTELDSYKCRYGFGYAIFNSSYKNIETELRIFAPFDDSLEIWEFKITNSSGEEADISVISYLEWCLGSSGDFHREFHKTFIETEFDKSINGIAATKRLWDIPLGDRGHWNIEYPYTGFIASNKTVTEFEGDKESFLGQYGSFILPESVKTGKLSGKQGKWNDSIGSIKIDVKIAKGNTEDFAVYIGLKNNKTEIAEAIKKYDTPQKIENAFNEVKKRWADLLGTLEINTPDPAMNLVVNKWFRYQAIAGRLWGRTAYYQQSGAFGFRDQLQDSLVYLPIDVSLTEKQIKLHARHQFTDGTVLHWWHPIAEVGLQTKMVDDLLWLPFLIYNYLDETDNYDFLNHKEPFYDDKQENTLLDHCKRSIDKVLTRYSERGLPLMGAGDWNDGLSAVGLEMKGESIWMAEFFYLILTKFTHIAEKTGNKKLAEYYTGKAKELKTAFDKYAWDGEWYYRGTKDSGIKIGSAECEEGKIYLNPQIWSVISGIAPDDKKETAMKSVKEHLLKNNGCLLLSPSYTKPDKYIGYLSRYAPSRRENGGVYTHAATWAIWAFSLLKDGKNTYEAYKRLSPVYSGMDPDKYVAEPYVTPGNIDGPGSPNYGMAGWTWYSGSASWFQKVIVDWILGVRSTEEGLIVDPCIPEEWNEYSVKRLFRGTTYNIKVINKDHVSSGVKTLIIDGKEEQGNLIKPLSKKSVEVTVLLGK